jgi:predicted negative regulator of RcsB-dependent stress response
LACYAEGDSPVLKIKPEDRFWIYIYGFTAFIMLAAMGVFGWLAWTSRQEPGIGRVAGARVQAPASAIPEERYELLAAFRAPEYVPESPAPKDFQNADFRKAMTRYANQDFARAIPELRTAANATPRFIAARFYLGICLLLTGDRISGIQELRAVTEAGDTAYLEPARFYLAKGLIAEHDIARAQTQLERLIAQHGDLEKQATVLLAQIRPAS